VIGLRSQRFVSFVSLFTSSGALICCAIPALLVSIGAGASLAGLVSAFPQLVWLSEHKIAIFVISGILILCSVTVSLLNRNAPCPIDPLKANACMRLRKWSFLSLSIAILFYLIGASFAFIIPALRG